MNLKDNPCKDCTRSWKKPGCHDACQDRKPWIEELERIKKNRKQYEDKKNNRYHR